MPYATKTNIRNVFSAKNVLINDAL